MYAFLGYLNDDDVASLTRKPLMVRLRLVLAVVIVLLAASDLAAAERRAAQPARFELDCICFGLSCSVCGASQCAEPFCCWACGNGSTLNFCYESQCPGGGVMLNCTGPMS